MVKVTCRIPFLAAIMACGPDTTVAPPDSTSSDSQESESGDETCPDLVWAEDDALSVTSAEQADALPRYTRVVGGLRIQGVANILDLSFLECLTEVEGYLVIADNPDLESLVGLERLTRVTADEPSGGVGIGRNARLRTVEGLSNLSETSSLDVEDNPMLESLEGLSSLVSVGWLSVVRNDSLHTIGLRALETAQDIQIGWAQCLDADVPPVAQGNAGLIDLDGFDSLVDYHWLRVGGNINLTSIAGLVGDLEGSSGTSIWIELNTSLPLTDVEGVEAALSGSYEYFKSCGNLDEPEACICLAPDPVL